MPPETLSTTLTYSASIPTTGQRTEPDGTATGSILLTNPLTRAITIAAGTTVTSDDGTDFVVTEDTLVPAADPYGTLTFGSATASIRASVAGPVGNVDAESISGQMDNAVFYTNRDATGGGSNKVIRTVSQDDIDTLQQQAQTALNGKVEGAIASLITAGQQLIPDSRSTAPMQANFSRTLGQDATDLSINAQMQVSALAYQPDALAQQAHAAATQKLTSMTGANDQLLANTVAVSNPTEVAGTNGTAFTITATGQVQARIDQHTLSALKSDIAGQDVEESLARVQQVPGVGTASIERSNAWLTRGMPRLSSRITIEVYGAQGVSTQTTSTRP